MPPNFHDGFLDGIVLLDEKTAHLFLRAVGGERYALVAHGVECLRASNFLLGNIIFDIEFLEGDQIAESYSPMLYELSPVDIDGQKARLLDLVRRKGLKLIVLSPSYGAECLLLAEHWAIEILSSDIKGAVFGAKPPTSSL